MASIFDELMKLNSQLTESIDVNKSKPVRESKKKIGLNKIKFESLKIFEDADLDDLDNQFAVDPENIQDDEVVLVIDPEIPAYEEVPEDAAENMVGDLVYKCPVCGSNYVCNCDAEMEEAVEMKDDGTPAECPICGDDADQILIGEIAPADEVKDIEDEREMDPVKPEDKEDEESEEVDEVEVSEEEDETKEESVKHIKESAASDDVTKYQKWVDYDMKHYGKISDKTKSILDKAGFEAVKDDHGDYEVIVKESCKTEDIKPEEAKEVCPKCHKDPCECKEECDKAVKEDFEHDELDAMELVDEVPAPSTPECAECEEKVEDEVEEKEEAPAVEVNAEVVNLTLDDKRFESLMNKMIKENYKGDKSFKLSKASLNKSNTLSLEYVVGKSIKGILVAEGFDSKSRKMTLKFRDKGAFTESFTKSPSFVVECIKVKNHVIPTKISYNFTKKVNESLYRVKGTVDNK